MRERVGDASALVSFFKRRVHVTDISHMSGLEAALKTPRPKVLTQCLCPLRTWARGGALRFTGPAHMPGQCNLYRGSSWHRRG